MNNSLEKNLSWVQDFDLYLFDFDGLLVDSERFHYEAYQKALANFGEKLSWDLLTFLGKAHVSSSFLQKALFQEYPKLFQTLDWNRFYQKKKEIYLHLLQKDTPSLMEGAKELLEAIFFYGKKAVIVTNSPKEQIIEMQKRLPILKKIAHLITREDYKTAKPSSECYEKAIALYANPEGKIIGFEDSLRGSEALVKTKALPLMIAKKDYPLLSKALKLPLKHFQSLSDITKDLLHKEPLKGKDL